MFGPSDEFDAVREVLTSFRRRGVDFGSAWRLAVEGVELTPETRRALSATRASWRRAYAGEPPTPGERLLGETNAREVAAV